MAKSQATIRKHLRALRRECIDITNDRELSRVAYAMECAVRWATEDVDKWPGLVEDAKAQTNCLKAGL